MITEDELKSFVADNNWSVGTQEHYCWVLSNLNTYLEKTDIAFTDLNARSIKDWFDIRHWSPNMRYQASCAIRNYSNWRYGQSAALSKFKLNKKDPGPQRTLEPDELSQVFSFFNIHKPKDVRDLAIMSLMLDTGIRSFELCGLLVKHLNLQKRRLDLLVKGGTWQEKVFSKGVADNLAMWLEVRQKLQVIDSQYVFVSVGGLTPGSQITTSGLRVILRRLSQAVGIEHFSPHAMRRTMATELTENGAPTRLVQVLGGWSDVKMVERYTKKLKPSKIDKYSPFESVASTYNYKHGFDLSHIANNTITYYLELLGWFPQLFYSHEAEQSINCQCCGRQYARQVYIIGRDKSGIDLPYTVCDNVCAAVYTWKFYIVQKAVNDFVEASNKG